VILCPINFVGRIRDSVADMAKTFSEQDGMEDLAARAAAVVIMSQPVRQGLAGVACHVIDSHFEHSLN
jgi:hypothetical protein